MAIDSMSVAALKALFDESPRSVEASIDLVWRQGAVITGPIGTLSDNLARVDLLHTMRILAMSKDCSPRLTSQLIENSTSVAPSFAEALHAAAAPALARPETMRWVSANAAHVASSPNWTAALPGLGGATVSVPLAEEALSHLLDQGARFSDELTRYIQVNPWFSRKFALRYRRYSRGKRLRFPERAATARAWSHARSLLRPELPAQWISRHGRGIGRPLDSWSHRLLSSYTKLLETAYRSQGIPPVIAALFAVASAADESSIPSQEAVAGWQALPEETEGAALRLVGLGEPMPPLLGPAPADVPAQSRWKLRPGSRGMMPKFGWF